MLEQGGCHSIWIVGRVWFGLRGFNGCCWWGGLGEGGRSGEAMIDVRGDGLGEGPGGLMGDGVAGGGKLFDELFAGLASGSTADLVRRYRAGVGVLDRRVFGLDERALGVTFGEGETVVDGDGVEIRVGRWSVRALLGHLADAELVLTMRMRRVLAEECPVLPLWDENAFLDSALYGGVVSGRSVGGVGEGGVGGWKAQAIGGHVAVVHTLRQWMGEWLGVMPMSAWNRRGMHETNGAMSLADLVVYSTWHLEHHASYLRGKLLVLLGPEVGEDGDACATAMKSGGCGPGCGCVGRGGEST